ncbi:hypothetical protein GLOTRDRAFT_125997 [Gloeophyllum trabeum ATCC 11539]|uniref:MARVEL domain-containing protein n=1 Tax=Gloeophyllum trabeum (strain ATCC 11539 / FP-39264 / Madison 617) TaxID=670483 RepID=S7S1Q3_GLOTA|nr:uncharacterized protein GLOTRDRAFT_125997 [Gloeophyllum trabeum ATCC 11539]EPQ59699.1 hypothetical protein GLOTRDRAFT_125997 [Gloeophyllum trabeum ATCC 11539]
MPFLSVLRLVIFVLALVFSVIALGIAADLMSLTETYFNVTLIFCILAVVSASLTIISLPIMLTLDTVRQGAFTSTVVFELSWLFVLWVLWIATAAEATYSNGLIFPSGCGYINPKINQGCQEFAAVQGFSFLTWIILMAYTIVLLVFAIIGTSRGNKVWLSSVRENNFLHPSVHADKPIIEEKYPAGNVPIYGVPTSPYQPPRQPTSPTFNAHPSNISTYQGTPSPHPAHNGQSV